MFGTFAKTATEQDALERLKVWTRERFGLAEDAPVFASEVTCSLPGCPPLETVVGFWTEGEKRHHFKIFKPAGEVVQDDLPPRWLRDALLAPEGAECCC